MEEVKGERNSTWMEKWRADPLSMPLHAQNHGTVFFFPAYLSRPYQPDYMFLRSSGSCFSKLMKKKFYGHMIRP